MTTDMTRTASPAPIAHAAGDEGPAPRPGGARPGTLYVVATPIGNLKDLSVRATDVLASVDWVAAEDTRVSRVLLDRVGGRGRMMAVHTHNETGASARVVDLLQGGASVALVSDAGTPAISDPGGTVVAAARLAGVTVVPLPGPSAPVTLLSAAGLPPAPFLFEGFLPPRETARRRRLISLRHQVDALGAHLILFEAPHRIDKTLASLLATHGPTRTVVIGRELTKLFEEIHVGPLADAAAWLAAPEGRRRGEFVVIVAAPGDTSRTGHAIDAFADVGVSGSASAGVSLGTSDDDDEEDEKEEESEHADDALAGRTARRSRGSPPAAASAPSTALPAGPLGLWPLGASQLHDPRALLTRLMKDLSPSRAVKLAQELTGLGHRELYDLALALKNDA